MKRIRLMIDVFVHEEDIPDLQNVINRQPVSVIQIEDYKPLTGRFIGAQEAPGDHE